MIWLVTRHPGAVDWFVRQGYHFDKHVSHLKVDEVGCGDHVMGSLPLDMVAELCQRGAMYWHLKIPLTPELRGVELSAEQLETLGANLQPYQVEMICVHYDGFLLN